MSVRTLDIAAVRVPARSRPLAMLWRPTVAIVLLATVATPFLLQPWVTSDGIGHYSYVRSLVFDHDVDFRNEFAHYNTVSSRFGPPTLEGDEASPSRHVCLNPVIETPVRTATGLTWNPWPVGSALLWAPFVLATWPIVEGLRTLGVQIANDGYGLPYALAVGLGTVVYGVIGLVLCMQLCARYFSSTASLLAVLATWFGSTFVFYLFVMPSYAHVNSMFAVTWFVWHWHRYFHDRATAPTGAAAFVLGLIGGLMMAVQWTNVTFLVTFGALAARSVWTSARPRGALGSLLRYGILLTAGWLVTFAPQLAVNKILYGGVLADPQPPGFFSSLTSPHILGVLFSSDRGLVFWTPLVLVCLAGLAFCPRPARLLAGMLGLNFLLQLYINASVDTWTGDSAFGQRRFTNLTLLFVLGLTALLARLENTRDPAGRWLRPLRVALPAAFVVWNMLLIVQYVLWIAPHTGEYAIADLLRGQVAALRQLGTVLRYVL